MQASDGQGRTGRGGADVVVVGGGIAGLAAAWYLSERAGRRVTVLEASPRVGGKLHASNVAGASVDEGAESLLVRRPEGLALARDLGLGDELVAPATLHASVVRRGRLHPLPRGQVMGVPADLTALARSGLLTVPELARTTLDHLLPRTPMGEDVAIGRQVRARLGAAVVDQLVEPLLGGVYAGHADELSFDMTVPALFAAATRTRSLLRAAAGLRRASTSAVEGSDTSAQVFASLPGGLARLVDRLVERLAERGVSLLTRTTARELRRTETGWALVVGAASAPRTMSADAVVLATPSAPASRLLAGVAPAAAAELAAIDYASMAIITLAYPRAAFARMPAGSGFLVPPREGRLVKAATFSSSKWGWYAEAAPGTVVVRLSVGRHGEAAALQRDDADLAAAAAAELGEIAGVSGPPVEIRVTRWGGALPQYAVGHRARVRRARAAIAEHPGLAVCGAAYDGIGIPACIGSARAAVAQLDRAVPEPLGGLGTTR
ncbi:MAG TPA: protoporphyrinogen oxidase [Actinomycetes bacterium]|nr:protoporphyrinogen oxidase [Actinomycetes bacterium]